MPNQRKKGKAFIGGYIPKNLAEAFKIAAEERGMTARDLLEMLIVQTSKKETTNEHDRKWKKVARNCREWQKVAKSCFLRLRGVATLGIICAVTSKG